MKLSDTLKTLRDEAKALYDLPVGIEFVGHVPERKDIPLEGPNWLRLDDVTCVYSDMMRSTQLSVRRDPGAVAKLYELFTSNAVRILNDFDAEYIDVRGDGAFALFTDRAGFYRAFAAAVTIKTFTSAYAAPIVKNSGLEFELASHSGMQFGRLLVKRIGLRGEMQNEVWAGRPVNVAAKLAAQGDENQLVVSKMVYDRFESELIYMSCGCHIENGVHTPGDKVGLWHEVSADSSLFGADTIYALNSNWCTIHGDATCKGILSL